MDRDAREAYSGGDTTVATTPAGSEVLPRITLDRGTDWTVSRARARREIERRDSIFRRNLAVADMASAAAAIVAVDILHFERVHLLSLMAVPLVILAGKLKGLYDRDELLINKTTLDQAPQLFQLATLYALVLWLFDGLLLGRTLGPVQVAVLWMLLFVFVVGARRVARWMARGMTTVERCLFVGSDGSFERLRAKLEVHPDRAVLVGRMAIAAVAAGSPGVSSVEQLDWLIDDLDVHRVIIEPTETAPQLTLDFVREAQAIGIRVSLLPRILEVVGSSIEVDDIGGVTLLGVRRFGLTASSRRLKRGFDVCASAIGLLAISPLIAAIAFLIKRDTPGPVIFGQTRIGRDGEAFTMLKFRTMIDRADEHKVGLRDVNEADGLFKIADDPRITRVGRWLRHSSLDELLQLVNVLRGEMSLVGPRPLVCDEDAKIFGLDRRRLHLMPGMTGPWQILGSARIPLAEMVKLDYLYVANWSPWADVKILIRTVPYVLARRGM